MHVGMVVVVDEVAVVEVAVVDVVIAQSSFAL